MERSAKHIKRNLLETVEDDRFCSTFMKCESIQVFDDLVTYITIEME